MNQTPLLFIGDSPSLHTGLARIGRDLATLVARLPEFRVGYLGRGGIGSRNLPFFQYDFDEAHGWGDERMVQHVWNNFAGDKPGICFSIWDLSRLHWFACGEWVTKMRQAGKLRTWAYAPVDSAGVNGKLTQEEAATIRAYDRILAYGEYGARIIAETIGASSVPWLPHGIDMQTFQPRDKRAARIAMQFRESDKVMGMVATNQARKDWGIAAQVLAMLPDWKAWWHVDTLRRHWDIAALIHEHGIQDRVKVTFTGEMSDVELSYFYSGCNVQLQPTVEGFGFGIAESLACGVPVIHARESGGNWDLPTVKYMDHVAERLEGLYHRWRLTFEAKDWALAVREWERPSAEACRASVEHLSWERLWKARWSKYFLEGAQ